MQFSLTTENHKNRTTSADTFHICITYTNTRHPFGRKNKYVTNYKRTVYIV